MRKQTALLFFVILMTCLIFVLTSLPNPKRVPSGRIDPKLQLVLLDENKGIVAGYYGEGEKKIIFEARRDDRRITLFEQILKRNQWDRWTTAAVHYCSLNGDCFAMQAEAGGPWFLPATSTHAYSDERRHWEAEYTDLAARALVDYPNIPSELYWEVQDLVSLGNWMNAANE
ncbi:hypothetical protein IT407_03175 [Candidatus Uhrbacteria bacterium]|nr:hypothetical protein [Candidatus Uhrbacteria bacterium]